MKNLVTSRKSRDLSDMAILLNVLVAAWEDLQRTNAAKLIQEFRLSVRMAMVRRLVELMKGGERNPDILRHHAVRAAQHWRILH